MFEIQCHSVRAVLLIGIIPSGEFCGWKSSVVGSTGCYGSW